MESQEAYLEELPRREVVLPNGQKVDVLRFVSRIDVFPTETKKRQTHGWQVRYRKTNKYFSDNQGSALDSLSRAEAFLRGIYSGYRAHIKSEDGPHKGLRLSHAGIRIRELGRTSRVLADGTVRRSQVRQVYVEVAHPFKGHSPRRFYVGTTGTATDERVQACVAKAIAYRKAAEEVLQAFRREVPPWSAESTLEHFKSFSDSLNSKSS